MAQYATQWGNLSLAVNRSTETSTIATHVQEIVGGNASMNRFTSATVTYPDPSSSKASMIGCKYAMLMYSKAHSSVGTLELSIIGEVGERATKSL